MSENRDAFGPLLRQLQVEMRSLKADVRALREEMGSRAYVDARAAETEALLETLFGRLNDRMDQTERSVEERLQRLESGQAEALILLRRLSTSERFTPRGAAPSPTPEQPSVIPLPAPK